MEDRGGWKRWTRDDAAAWVARPVAGDDKYSRGVLGMITGSTEYPGAAILGVEAAHRAGVGMVRYVGRRRVREAVLQRRPETVTHEGRVQAWLLGSGMDPMQRSFVLMGELQHALASGVPVVLDAGALDLVGTHTAPTVITPHAGELVRVLHTRDIDVELADVRAAPTVWAERAAHELGVVVVLKGATTHVCDPDGARYELEAPTHWLATAGTGDVLAGALGALAATHHGRLQHDASVLTSLAATAVFLHGDAAARASERVAGGPITALDVAENLATSVGELLAGR